MAWHLSNTVARCSLESQRSLAGVPSSPIWSRSTSSVANFAQGAMKGQLLLSRWGLRGQRVEQFGRSEALLPGLNDHLSFRDHMHEFDPNQGILSCVKRFKPQHRPCHPLHCSMILLHDII